MTLQTLQSHIAKLLGTSKNLTSKQCAVEIEKIGARLEVIRARSDAITSSPTGRGKLGSERVRIAVTGSPEDLIALNHEEELLEAEDSSFCHQRDALRKRQEKAVIEESAGLARVAIKRLGPALKAAEAANERLAKALASLEDLKNEIRASRRMATDANLKKVPVVKPDDFDRLAKLLGWDYIKPPFISKSNVENARADRRAELTGWTREQPFEPEMPWQRVERMRQGDARRKKAYMKQPSEPAA